MLSTNQAAPSLFLTELDVVRLERLASRAGAPHMAEMLDHVLARATIVPPQDIPHDIVTMNSRVTCMLAGEATPREWTLVYPDSADYDAGRISVLSPVGGALLGVHAGQTVGFQLPDGRAQQLVVTAIGYQPEAHGEYTI
ncbi:nucleoside diphosphate kinase regulator [Cupriavidus pampae]|uniref:Regulator of nucleoside diphosphate kinase n=1 Tax=Cupriavidus pampae TaxID=659251 RepID=A0ABM8WZA9_9BURK|nr:nucleoside diphosphate kinase regulator [Cupriavidus pampae]CAG9172910.1 Regulator of nucleoside diphosphate kinase [Cupriavidus pampae]